MFGAKKNLGENFWVKKIYWLKQERDVLQERKEAIFNYLNLFLSIWIYFYLSESYSICD